jgi:hypothetical protein
MGKLRLQEANSPACSVGNGPSASWVWDWVEFSVGPSFPRHGTPPSPSPVPQCASCLPVAICVDSAPCPVNPADSLLIRRTLPRFIVSSPPLWRHLSPLHPPSHTVTQSHGHTPLCQSPSEPHTRLHSSHTIHRQPHACPHTQVRAHTHTHTLTATHSSLWWWMGEASRYTDSPSRTPHLSLLAALLKPQEFQAALVSCLINAGPCVPQLPLAAGKPGFGQHRESARFPLLPPRELSPELQPLCPGRLGSQAGCWGHQICLFLYRGANHEKTVPLSSPGPQSFQEV